MRPFDHAVLVGGAALALLAGVTSGELGLAPMRDALAAQAAPSPDMTSPDAAPRPLQAYLPRETRTPPPAVIAPVSTARAPSGGADEDRAPRAEEEARRADAVDTRDVLAPDSAPEIGRAPEAADGVPDPGAPAPAAEAPAEDPAPATAV